MTDEEFEVACGQCVQAFEDEGPAWVANIMERFGLDPTNEHQLHDAYHDAISFFGGQQSALFKKLYAKPRGRRPKKVVA